MLNENFVGLGVLYGCVIGLFFVHNVYFLNIYYVVGVGFYGGCCVIGYCFIMLLRTLLSGLCYRLLFYYVVENLVIRFVL